MYEQLLSIFFFFNLADHSNLFCYFLNFKAGILACDEITLTQALINTTIKAGLLSRTTIMTLNLHACTLVLIMVLLIVGDVLEGSACGAYNGPRFFGVQASHPKFGKLVISRGLNVEEETKPALCTLVENWSYSLDESNTR